MIIIKFILTMIIIEITIINVNYKKLLLSMLIIIFMNVDVNYKILDV